MANLFFTHSHTLCRNKWPFNNNNPKIISLSLFYSHLLNTSSIQKLTINVTLMVVSDFCFERKKWTITTRIALRWLFGELYKHTNVVEDLSSTPDDDDNRDCSNNNQYNHNNWILDASEFAHIVMHKNSLDLIFSAKVIDDICYKNDKATDWQKILHFTKHLKHFLFYWTKSCLPLNIYINFPLISTGKTWNFAIKI